MVKLITRLGRGAGAALETFGEETLKDVRFNMETQRLERLEDIRNNYAMQRLERQGEINEEAATVAHGRALERDAATVAANEEAATVAAGRQTDRDATLSQYRREETTHALEEEARVETGGLFSQAADARIEQQAEEIFDGARDGPGLRKNFDLERWSGSKSRALADVRDKIRQGWTESQIYDYLIDGTVPENTDSTSRPRATLDQILSNEIKPGVTQDDVLQSVLSEPRLTHLHEEARALLNG